MSLAFDEYGRPFIIIKEVRIACTGLALLQLRAVAPAIKPACVCFAGGHQGAHHGTGCPEGEHSRRKGSVQHPEDVAGTQRSDASLQLSLQQPVNPFPSPPALPRTRPRLPVH